MKKIILLIITLSLSLNTIAQRKRIALVSIGVNKKFNTTNLTRGNKEFEKKIEGFANGKLIDFDPFVVKQKDAFFNEYKDVLPFDLVDENLVLNNSEYLDFKPMTDLSFYNNMAVPLGYKFARDGFDAKYNEEGLAKIFGKEYDGVLFIYNEFMFRGGVSFAGVGTTYIACEVKFALYNKVGAKLFSFVEIENCKTTIVKTEGFPIIPSEDKFYEHMKCAFENVNADMKERIKKQSEKIEKKLNK